MAMRYVYRRPTPEDFSDIKALVPDLDKQLGQPGENFRRSVRLPISTLRYAQYTFVTRKTGTNWQWLGTSVELVAEDEKGLFALVDHFKIARPSHLAHLS